MLSARVENTTFSGSWLLAALAAMMISTGGMAGERLCDHEAVFDAQGRLLPWTSYDRIVRGSMEYVKHCFTVRTTLGDDPWFLVTSSLTPEATFKNNQNNQGSNVYYAAETLARYYAYCGDKDIFKPVRLLLDRVLMFHTPGDWAWPNVPRTQDDTPDGEYTDETSEPDKMCMVGSGYLRFYKLTGERKYLDAALEIAKTVAGKIRDGDADRSPLPFRVNLKTGEVLEPYSANMVAPVIFFDALMALGHGVDNALPEKRAVLWRWILEYPMKNYRWTGYYEDVKNDINANLNQQIPMETARYLLRVRDDASDWRTQAPALIEWVRNRFGATKRFGATSIREQDGCFFEMSSHTARYASVVALWYGFTGKPEDREEARASFALATYSAFSKYSEGERAVNYVGLGYVRPWFSDSYVDYLPHLMDGMAEMPDMAPEDENHILGSTSTVTQVTYGRDCIEYETFDPRGDEILRITFKPAVLADDKPLDPAQWTHGEFRGVSNVLRIHRINTKRVRVESVR
ncbi:MAG TPA: hypothetical protein PKO36_14745 [Candidatus Hydrogenedentes bacterium]|nr:hypothetical protein [Candidatus Hydrogenedentota bacterium]HOV75305.1 hypothetical protein [Candidatus Hydrogenedentota bacterium]HPC17164.1 hypothetical protein [Candidatus Hydrogenedentota bacterium]HRT21065.1 hypothetical protein [Candidatus Hydrogenedentota bacterium]HRT65894.1 hypothetical protein [Candidatus Hydrogenedentota bacterium]